MSGFTLDTSGIVLAPRPGAEHFPDGWMWHHLDPFTQGYIEALMRQADADGVVVLDRWGDGDDDVDQNRPGFSDLAPEALALILRDCAKVVAFGAGAVLGREFWNIRQEGKWHFPPLTPYLREDGKVDLRETKP